MSANNGGTYPTTIARNATLVGASGTIQNRI